MYSKPVHRPISIPRGPANTLRCVRVMTGEATFCYYNIGGSWGRLFNNVKCEKQHWGLFLIKKYVFTLTYFGKSLIDRWFIQTLSERNVSSYLAPHSSVRGWFINQVYRAFKQMTIAFIFLRLSFTMSRMKPQKEHGDKNRFKKKASTLQNLVK